MRQIALLLGGLLSQNVRLESMLTLDLPRSCNGEALFRAAFGLHLRHGLSSKVRDEPEGLLFLRFQRNEHPLALQFGHQLHDSDGLQLRCKTQQ